MGAGKPAFPWFYPVLSTFMVKVFSSRLQVGAAKKARYLVGRSAGS